MTWHFPAERLDGAGGSTPIDSDLPLTDVTVNQTLSGPDTITASVSPAVGRMIADDGMPVLQGDYTTAIYAVDDEQVMAGVILDQPTFAGQSLSLEGGGFAGYAYGQPYTDSHFWIQIDAIDAFRQIWLHLAAQDHGDFGLVLDSTTMSGHKIGTALQQGQFDTISGPLTYESGPFRLAWYQTFDLGAEMDKLVQANAFDWRERHWYDGNVIRHNLDFGAPKIGRRIEDMRFVVGENISVVPTVVDHGDEYADEALVLGAGEGAAMIRGSYSAPKRGMRRVRVIEDKRLKTVAAANAKARAVVQQAQNIRDVQQIVLWDHPHAPAGAVQAGDEIYIEGRLDWVELGMWVRVTQRSIRPSDLSSVTLTVTRTDRMPA